MNKKEMLEKVKEINIDAPFLKEIYEFLDQHIDRVEFVKDHIGLRDFFFLAEEGTTFAASLFSAVNTNVRRGNSNEMNERAFQEAYLDDPIDVVKGLEEFFLHTDRTMYVGIGFSESDLDEEQIMKVREMLVSNQVEDHYEALANSRKFPSWYEENAKYPSEIFFVTKEEEEKQAQDLLTQKKENIMTEINALLDKEEKTEEDEKRFMELSNELNKLKENV